MTPDPRTTREMERDIYYDFARLCVRIFDESQWIDKSDILTGPENSFFDSVEQFIRDEMEREVRIEKLRERSKALAEREAAE